jgi:hypothetical protein
MIRRLLTVLGTSQPPSNSRDRLRAAIEARDRAQVELDNAHAAVARVEDIIESAYEADRTAAKAKIAADVAAEAWASGGCDPHDSEHDRLSAIAAQAEHGAQQSDFLAIAANAGLSKVNDAQSRCESVLSGAQAEVRESIGVLFVGEIRPELDAMERAAREFERARLEVIGLYRLLDPTRLERRPNARERRSSEDHQGRPFAKRDSPTR